MYARASCLAKLSDFPNTWIAWNQILLYIYVGGGWKIPAAPSVNFGRLQHSMSINIIFFSKMYGSNNKTQYFTNSLCIKVC